MGYCDPDNFAINLNMTTSCTSGYDEQQDACCNRSMYIFWNVVIWVFLVAMCTACCWVTCTRVKKAQQMAQARQAMQNQGQMGGANGNMQQPFTQQQQQQPQYQAFAGQPVNLGGGSQPMYQAAPQAQYGAPPMQPPAPSMQYAPPPQQAPTTMNQNQSVNGVMPYVNPNLPTTTLQIRLYGGSTTKAVFNLTNTVDDLYKYVDSVAGTRNRYQLMTGYPPQAVNNRSLTLEQAGLRNCSLFMRL